MADFAKKLTVSFGAFSCTLSGFDDPFPVMSQVVDYFQALSKSDPSFGAHPERPDTEALRILAEKTSGLSVGAEIQGDEVILSSVEDSFDAEPGDATFEATTTELPIEKIVTPTLPLKSIEEIHNESPSEKPVEDMSTLVSAAMAEAETEEKVNEISAEQPVEQYEIEQTDQNNDKNDSITDPFGHVQMDDLDDEMFGDIDAAAIYDAVSHQEPAPSPVEDMSGYLKEAVQFTDVENPEMDGKWEEASQEDATPLEVQANLDQVPVWETELVSDEPIEEVEESLPVLTLTPAPETPEPSPEVEEEALTYDDHVEAEKTALAHILAATQAPDTLDETNPLVAFDDEISSQSDETPQSDDARNTAKSLVLGFGDAASLDATGQVTTETLDTRSDPSSEALIAMGMHEDEKDDFGWTADDDTPAENAEAAPLLLTPMQQINSVEDDLEVISDTPPTPQIDLNQDDPRPDLRRFAAAAGAASMTELLEASAAYSTLVSGRPSFSRGEVLDLLDEFSDDNGFSQEARIKTFGSLLRGGRIQSVGNGDYEMTIDALSDYEGSRRAG